MSTEVLIGHGQPEPEVQVVKRSLGLGSLVFIMFFTVSGGAYGLEDVIGESSAGAGLLLIVLTPIIWSLRLVFTEDLGEEVEELYEDAWERVLAS